MKESSEAIGVRHNADGTTDAGARSDRCIMHIDRETVALDPEVIIEGDPTYGFILTAPFTPSEIRTTVASRIIYGDERGWVVDQHALLTRAYATGERVFHSKDFLVAV